MMADGESAEAYMIGSEGFTGVTAWQVPSQASVRFFCHLAGSAQRIEAARLRDLASERVDIRRVLAGYEAALIVELEQTAPCNALHATAPRFAKWLLRAHDRADRDTLFMTQEFLAKMTSYDAGDAQMVVIGGRQPVIIGLVKPDHMGARPRQIVLGGR